MSQEAVAVEDAEVAAPVGTEASLGTAGAVGWDAGSVVGPVTSVEVMPRSGAFGEKVAVMSSPGELGAKLAGLSSAGDVGVKPVGLSSVAALADSGVVGAAGSQAPGSGGGTSEAMDTPWSIEDAHEGFAGAAPVGEAAIDGSAWYGLLVSFWATTGSQAWSGAGAEKGLGESEPSAAAPLEPAGLGGVGVPVAANTAQSKGAIAGASPGPAEAEAAGAAPSSRSVSP